MSRGWTAAIVAVAIALGWYFGSPHWTIIQIISAAEARDTDRLSAYIDFPALRESLKSEFKAKLTNELMTETDSLKGFGGLMALNMADIMIDGLVTPEMLRATFDESSVPSAKTPFGIRVSNAEFVRDSLDQFRLRKADGSALVFERRGLGWKLVAVRTAETGATNLAQSVAPNVTASDQSYSDENSTPTTEKNYENEGNEGSSQDIQTVSSQCYGYWLKPGQDAYVVSAVPNETTGKVSVRLVMSNPATPNSGREYKNLENEIDPRDSGTGEIIGDRLTTTFGNIESVDLSCTNDAAVEADQTLNRITVDQFNTVAASYTR